MSTLTPSLSALVLCCTAFPVQLFRMAGMSAQRPMPALMLPGVVTVMAALAWYAAPVPGLLRLPAATWWWGAAVGLGVAAPLVEYAVGVLATLARRRRIAGFGLHERAQRATVIGVSALVVVAVAEELIFRGLWLPLLRGQLGCVTALAVALAAVVYGLNHLYFGWLTVVQKAVTGAVLGAAYLACGGSVLVPAVAHVVQNLVVMLVIGRLAAGRPPLVPRPATPRPVTPLPVTPLPAVVRR
jgi:membrane protease YdiL (CAAX protease family)